MAGWTGRGVGNKPFLGKHRLCYVRRAHFPFVRGIHFTPCPVDIYGQSVPAFLFRPLTTLTQLLFALEVSFRGEHFNHFLFLFLWTLKEDVITYL